MELRDLRRCEEDEGLLTVATTFTFANTWLAWRLGAFQMLHPELAVREEAVLRVDPNQLDQLLHPRIDPKAKVEVVVTGLPASPGAAWRGA